MLTRVGNSEEYEFYARIVEENKLISPKDMEDMVASHDDTKGCWFTTVDDDGNIKGVAYCANEKVANGVVNILILAMAREIHGQGAGTQLLAFIEDFYKQKGIRMIVVDTSSLPEFQKACKFYEKNRYEKVSVIKDFWDEGEDKFTYKKKLI